MNWRTGVLIFAALPAACSSAAPSVPNNVRIGGAPVNGKAVNVTNGAPRIESIWFNSRDVGRPGVWQGRIDTTSNVASVEVRSNLFSINAHRSDYGHFDFDMHILDVPPIFIRGYDLRVIARNAAGDKAEEDLPFAIH